MPKATITEHQFTETVIQLAKFLGWQVAHFRPALDRGQWRTAMSGDVGFPDLVLARHGVVIFAELKSDLGKLRQGQKNWIFHLYPQGPDATHMVYVWRPADLDKIKEILR